MSAYNEAMTVICSSASAQDSEPGTGSSYQSNENSSMRPSRPEAILPGFRFHPTDEELVGYYLRYKVMKKLLAVEVITQLDIYKYDPWELPKMAAAGKGEKECYFFCPRDRKYRNSARPNRVTGAGFWKATGTDRPIYSSSTRGNGPGHGEGSKCIGLKKSLVFYKGRAAKGIKTDWMMHEFRLPSSNSNEFSGTITNSIDLLDGTGLQPDAWALCRIFKKSTLAPRMPFTHATKSEQYWDPKVSADHRQQGDSSQMLPKESIDDQGHDLSDSGTTGNLDMAPTHVDQDPDRNECTSNFRDRTQVSQMNFSAADISSICQREERELLGHHAKSRSYDEKDSSSHRSDRPVHQRSASLGSSSWATNVMGPSGGMIDHVSAANADSRPGSGQGARPPPVPALHDQMVQQQKAMYNRPELLSSDQSKAATLSSADQRLESVAESSSWSAHLGGMLGLDELVPNMDHIINGSTQLHQQSSKCSSIINGHTSNYGPMEIFSSFFGMDSPGIAGNKAFDVLNSLSCMSPRSGLSVDHDSSLLSGSRAGGDSHNSFSGQWHSTTQYHDSGLTTSSGLPIDCSNSLALQYARKDLCLPALQIPNTNNSSHAQPPCWDLSTLFEIPGSSTPRSSTSRPGLECK